ncbi:bifunctional 4-hydroxy-2-oxoglutarate aldolase/2-dehydro-3-deoxy-phosphogluconate aldolase, partial [Carboxylicivirga sediminis]|nr:bifunctional 4-hydroxy-2-oxoglutarate aldolase/2-dehydro-3-deoxy-phosphogluconate aldolase [Carboxylicivirga sediminis]
FVKAVKAPMPWTDVMPTGGVTCEKENLSEWFAVGVTCVGIGSNLFSKAIMERQDWEMLEEKAKELIVIIGDICSRENLNI